MFKKYKSFLAGIVGNTLEHYDTALYGLMVPFIAPNFFPNDEPIIALIKTFGLVIMGTIARPFGALFFGYMATNKGGKFTLTICIIGTAITTGIMAFLPTYEQVGWLAPVLLAIVRVIQGIFAAGEMTVAAFYILQNTPPEKYTRMSGFYNCSTMFGVVLASLAATIISNTSTPEYYWRYAFLLGFCTALGGIWLRTINDENNNNKSEPLTFDKLKNILTQSKFKILRVMAVSSFSYITYTIPFVFMNNFVPQITDISLKEMLELNSFLLILDTSLIPLFALIAEQFNRAKFMALISLSLAITIIPFFNLLPHSSYITIIGVRLWIICLGLAFLAPLQAWYFELFKGQERYLLTGIGYSLGSELFGRPSSAICLSLWYYFEHPIAPAIYVVLIGLLATLALIPSSNFSVKIGK